MYPIDSPHLKILPENFTEQERHQYLRNMSLARAFYFNKKNTKLGLDSIEYPLSHVHQSYFLAQLSVGTPDPPFTPFVAIDMTSDQTWFQCAKCDPCFNLDKSYNPEASSSFAKLALLDDRCNPQKRYAGTCGFEASFGRGRTDGYVGTDTFSFSNALGSRVYVPNIAFGCGIHNKNFHWPMGKGIAGVHGMGLGPRSFLTQLSDEIQGRFSYCIPRETGKTVLTFGDAAKISKDAGKIAMNPEARYHLHLTGLSVDEILVTVPSSVFTLDAKDYKTGFFIDPNTPITVLNTLAYTALVSDVALYFQVAFKWVPDPLPGIAICYSEDPGLFPGFAFPVIGLHFKSSVDGDEEVTLNLPHETVFKPKPLPLPGFCLNIESTSGPSIFGAYQQSNHRFLFDVNAGQLSFVEENC